MVRQRTIIIFDGGGFEARQGPGKLLPLLGLRFAAGLLETDVELTALGDPRLVLSFLFWIIRQRTNFGLDRFDLASAYRLYHRGVMPDGEAVGAADHRTRLKVRPFKQPATE